MKVSCVDDFARLAHVCMTPHPASAETVKARCLCSNSSFSRFFFSYTGEVGLQADAENPETARVPLAGRGGWAWRGVSVVGGAVEPSEDAGRHEEPPQQERPDSLVRVPG